MTHLRGYRNLIDQLRLEIANMGIFSKPLKLIRIVGFLIGLLSLFGWLIGLFLQGLKFLNDNEKIM